MTSEQEAADALAGMRQARIRANNIRRLPFLYHLAFGALTAGFIVVMNLPKWSFALGLAGLMLGAGLLYRWQRQSTGRWINGYRSGRTLPVAILIVATLCGLMFVSVPEGAPTFNLLTPAQGAILAFFAGSMLDWLWVKVYDREQSAGR